MGIIVGDVVAADIIVGAGVTASVNGAAVGADDEDTTAQAHYAQFLDENYDGLKHVLQ